jgi:hypothetical protein
MTAAKTSDISWILETATAPLGRADHFNIVSDALHKVTCRSSLVTLVPRSLIIQLLYYAADQIAALRSQ